MAKVEAKHPDHPLIPEIPVQTANAMATAEAKHPAHPLIPEIPVQTANAMAKAEAKHPVYPLIPNIPVQTANAMAKAEAKASCPSFNPPKSQFRQFPMENAMQHEDITYRIIGAAMTVHSELGNGFQEVIYQRALEIEMNYLSISFEREKEMPVFYRGEQIGTRRVDFFVEGLVMVELKAVVALEGVHLAQALNYLEAYHMKIGLLLNFGAKSLEHRRLENRKMGGA